MIGSDMKLEQSGKKFGRLTSFNRKNSIIHIKQNGQEQRPHIHRVMSGEFISDKVYELMESYIPKGIPDI